MHKHLKYSLKKIPKFKHIHHIKKDQDVEITGGSIFSKDSVIWNIKRDYGDTLHNSIISYGNSASTMASNGGGLSHIDHKLMNLNFGRKNKIKF